MADLHHRDVHARRGSSSPDTLVRGTSEDPQYNEKSEVVAPAHAHDHVVEYEAGNRLQRGLKARHITMIAIGGAIGKSIHLLDHLAASNMPSSRYWSDHWHWICSGSRRPWFHLHFLHRRRLPGLSRHVCSWRNGRMASYGLRLHWLCCPFL